MTSEAPSGIAPQSPDANPVDGAQTGKSRKKRWGRRAVVLALAVLLMLGIVGGAGGIYLYNKKTAIDRSTPLVAVEQFLTAVFIYEDAARVQLFVCGTWDVDRALQTVNSLPDPTAHVSWDPGVIASQTSDRADVDVRMRYRYPGDIGPSGEEQWRFDLVNSDGWRVCGVGKA